jgi:hypothetical protein
MSNVSKPERTHLFPTICPLTEPTIKKAIDVRIMDRVKVLLLKELEK